MDPHLLAGREDPSLDRLITGHLQELRTRGYAIDLGDVDVELRCVATPIFGPDGPVAAFAIAAPAFRLTDERFPEFIAAARRASEEIARRVGHIGQPQRRMADGAPGGHEVVPRL